QAALERFREIMDDDFSTPEAVSLMFGLVREGNRIADAGGDAASLAGAVEEIVAVLGIYDALPAPDEIPDVSAVAERFGVTSSGAEAIEDLIEMRRVARAERRFEEADAIRTPLEGAGGQLEDGPDGTRWVRLYRRRPARRHRGRSRRPGGATLGGEGAHAPPGGGRNPRSGPARRHHPGRRRPQCGRDVGAPRSRGPLPPDPVSRPEGASGAGG